MIAALLLITPPASAPSSPLLIAYSRASESTELKAAFDLGPLKGRWRDRGWSSLGNLADGTPVWSSAAPWLGMVAFLRSAAGRAAPFTLGSLPPQQREAVREYFEDVFVKDRLPDNARLKLGVLRTVVVKNGEQAEGMDLPSLAADGTLSALSEGLTRPPEDRSVAKPRVRPEGFVILFGPDVWTERYSLLTVSALTLMEESRVRADKEWAQYEKVIVGAATSRASDEAGLQDGPDLARREQAADYLARNFKVLGFKSETEARNFADRAAYSIKRQAMLTYSTPLSVGGGGASITLRVPTRPKG